jgi:hypothetical protein
MCPQCCYIFVAWTGAEQDYTVKTGSRNSDVDNGGANQTTWGSENSCFHVVWFCATLVNIGIWRIPTWLFYSVALPPQAALIECGQHHHQ